MFDRLSIQSGCPYFWFRLHLPHSYHLPKAWSLAYHPLHHCFKYHRHPMSPQHWFGTWASSGDLFIPFYFFFFRYSRQESSHRRYQRLVLTNCPILWQGALPLSPSKTYSVFELLLASLSDPLFTSFRFLLDILLFHQTVWSSPCLVTPYFHYAAVHYRNFGLFLWSSPPVCIHLSCLGWHLTFFMTSKL